jgi:hypothetical protein
VHAAVAHVPFDVVVLGVYIAWQRQ